MHVIKRICVVSYPFVYYVTPVCFQGNGNAQAEKRFVSGQTVKCIAKSRSRLDDQMSERSSFLRGKTEEGEFRFLPEKDDFRVWGRDSKWSDDRSFNGVIAFSHFYFHIKILTIKLITESTEVRPLKMGKEIPKSLPTKCSTGNG